MMAKDGFRFNPAGAFIPGALDVSGPGGKCLSDFRGNGWSGPNKNSGYCADLFGRTTAPNVWIDEEVYQVFQIAYATKGKCVGCALQGWRYHTASEGGCYGNGHNQPCKASACPNTCNGWKITWVQCKMPDVVAGCTNPNSFGLITNSTDADMGNAGSPNGVCIQNCMQLKVEYYEDFAAWGSASIPTAARFNGFNKDAMYDSEISITNPNQPLDDITSGIKLIYAGGGDAGGAPNKVAGFRLQYGSTRNCTWGSNFDTWNCQPSVSIHGNKLCTGIIQGQSSANAGWRGYLHTSWNVNNAFGQLDDNSSVATFPGTSGRQSHLWQRKSKFKIKGTQTSHDDCDVSCGYVSFGCTDRKFGSYDSTATLNCDGRQKNNYYVEDSNGDLWCPSHADGPTSFTNPAGSNTDYCVEQGVGLDCSVCVDTSGSPDPQDLNYNANYGNYSSTLPGCTTNIFRACGGTGMLSNGAWSAMWSNKPTSYLYGAGQFWDKSGRRWGSTTPYGTWNNANTDRPLCQCNNEGCMDAFATNYSPLNISDCSGNKEPFYDPINCPTCLPMDKSCCIIQKRGCTDPLSPNYFCTVDLDLAGGPDNEQWCMDPTTGIPCDQTSCLNVTPVGGIPLGTNNGQWPWNPVINLLDDGSCDVVLISGCKDDGGVSAGGFWTGPTYPGYSALNYDASATIHLQSACVYAKGCPDSLASNYGTLCVPCGSANPCTYADMRDYVNNLPADPQSAGWTIDVQFVEDNMVPDASCCDFNLPGAGPGCTDPSALNYNPQATSDDGSCIYPEEGCTDPNAINYNPLATLDDGTCLYTLDFPEEGTNFLDGSVMQLCREPLTKEEVLMNVCQPTEIQSEVFIERGKQTVYEPNQRLGEVNTIGGLEIYGYGFYNIKTQI